MVTERAPLVRDITHAGKTYRYSTDDLVIDQVIVVIEIYEFKRGQVTKPPARLDQMRIAGGDEYFQRALSNLLLPVEGGVMLPYSRRDADGEILEFVRRLPAKMYRELKEIVDDFFSSQDMSEIASDVHARGNLNLADILQIMPSYLTLNAAVAQSRNSSNDDSATEISVPPTDSSLE